MEENIPTEEKKSLNHFNDFKKKLTKLFSTLSKDYYFLTFLIILSLAIVFRLKYFSMESIWNDAAVHLWYSFKAATDPLSMIFNIDYYTGDYALPQTITAVYYLFIRDIFVAGKLMALTYSIVGITFMYFLGKELNGKFTGLIAATLFAFNHIFSFYSVRPLGDAPVTVSLVIFLYCLIRFEKSKNPEITKLTDVEEIKEETVKKETKDLIDTHPEKENLELNSEAENNQDSTEAVVQTKNASQVTHKHKIKSDHENNKLNLKSFNLNSINLKSITLKSVKAWTTNNPRYYWAFLTAISLIATLFHKMQAVLFILGFFIYYILIKRQNMFKDKAVLISWLIPVGTVISAHLIANTFFNANLLGRLFGLMTQQRGMPFGLEALDQLKYILGTYLIILFIIGLIFTFIYKQKKIYPLLIIGFTYYLYFETSVDHTQDRYMLPLLSIAVLLAAFAIEEISSIASKFSTKHVKVILIVIITLFLAIPSYTVADQIIEARSMSYAGLQEAGDFLMDNMGDDDLLFSGSPRMMHAFSGVDYYSEGALDSPILGGNLYWLRGERYHENFRDYDYCDQVLNSNGQQNFEKDMKNLSADNTIWLEIDIWEYTQPRWYYDYCGGERLTQGSLDYFSSVGFQLQHVVVRDLDTSEAVQESTIIFIFKLDQGSFVPSII